ncbi:MAG: hypothetical protein Q9165_000695 [Trypethelium subeluteriae]
MNSGNLPFKIKELHDEYGPIVRVSTDELSFNDTRAWKDIFNRKDLSRPPAWESKPPGVNAYSVISAPPADHSRLRKALNPAFSEKATREYEPIIRAYLNKLLSRLDEAIVSSKKRTAVVDLVEWVNFYTFDVIGELMWSKDYDCLENGSGHVFMGVLMHFQAALIGATIKYYPWLDWVMAKITPKSTFEMLENVFKDGHQRLQDRISTKSSPHPDLVGYLVEHNAKAEPSEKMSDAEVEQNVLAIIVGGSETLTTTFSGAFHYLLANRSKLDRLVTEVRSNFSSEAEINAFSAATNLPYLNAIIEETLRLCPPIPDCLRREITPSAAKATFAGEVLPARTTVSVSCYTMFHSAVHFQDPEAFEPERWMNSQEYPAFHPFGMGPRGCLAQPLARLEMRLLLALFLYRYDIDLSPGESLRKWTEQKIYWTWEKQPLKLEIKPAKA